MNVLQSLETLPLTQAVGWALVHFVWQGALIALLLAGTFRLLRHRSAGARYLVGCAGMIAMLAAPLLTIVVAWPGSAPAPALAAVEIPGPAWGRLAPFLPAFTLVWFGGVLLLQTRLILSWSHAQRLKRFGIRPAPARWEAVVGALSARMGVRAGVRIVESTVAGVPMLIGWLRPVILVPTAAFTGLTPAQLRSIIAHELTHVRRHDYLVNLAQAVFETVLFYHPAVWWLSDRIRIEREYCCDDVAVRVCGDALCYARALSTLDGLRGDDRQTVLASTGGSLMDRIRRIAGARSAPARRLGGWIAPAAIAMSVTAAVSAMAVTTAARTAAADDALRPLDRVNLVNILKEHRSEQTELIAFLAEHGMDNRVLMAVLEELGTDERVFKAVDRATEREAYVESHMPEARQWVADELAAGRISMDDARAHLDMVRRELSGRARAEQRARDTRPEPVQRREGLERRLAEVELELADRVAAGRLSERDAKAALDAARHDIRIGGWLDQRGRLDDERREDLKQRMTEFHRRLEDDLAAGRITEAEAQERMERGKKELHAILGAESMKRLPARTDLAQKMAEMELRYKDIKRELEHAVASGALDEDAAGDKLRGFEHEIDRLEQHMVLQKSRMDELEAVANELRANGASDEEIKRKLAEHGMRHRMIQRREPPAGKRIDRRGVDEGGRLPGAEADRKLAAEHEKARRHKKRAAQYKLSAEDRKALTSGLDRARSQIEKAIADGTVTAAQAAERLERLAHIEQALSEKDRQRADAERKRRIEAEKAASKEKPAGR